MRLSTFLTATLITLCAVPALASADDLALDDQRPKATECGSGASARKLPAEPACSSGPKARASEPRAATAARRMTQSETAHVRRWKV